MSPVNFESDASEVLLNPRMAPELAESLRARLKVVADLPAHVFLLTSGSTASSEADYKWVALSKAGILASARASNEVLGSDEQDVWFHSLPGFHVGGMSIWARATLSGARVVQAAFERWDPALYVAQSAEAGATLSSLVPAQVHDLVRANLTAPASLRAILVGGGALTEDLYAAARTLGWPVLPTYGLSETASQAATERIEGPHRLQALPHLEIGTDDQGRIRVRGDSLLTGYVVHGPQFVDPKDSDGWYTTEDLGIVEGQFLTVTGRTQERIKIGGELSNLGLLSKIFAEEARQAGVIVDTALAAPPDERLEHIIVLATAGNDPALKAAVANFDARVLPFERIRAVRLLERIPRTELGKVKQKELLALLSTP